MLVEMTPQVRIRIETLEVRNTHLADENKKLADRVLFLEKRLAEIESKGATSAQATGTPLELIAAAVLRALEQAEAASAEHTDRIRYIVAGIDCNIRGILGISGPSLTLRPVDMLQVQPSELLSAVRFSVLNIPSGISSSR